MKMLNIFSCEEDTYYWLSNDGIKKIISKDRINHPEKKKK